MAARFKFARSRTDRIAYGLAFAMIAALVCLLLPAVQGPRRASPRSQCKIGLKQIELALHTYHDFYGSFPPAITYGPDGKPWHSWRTLLLRHVDQQAIYEAYRFDEPWNGPHNSELAKKVGVLEVFHCPQDENAPPGDTSYVAVIGDGTMWPPLGVAALDDVSDNKSPTLHVVEVSDSGVHWMQPLDLRLDTMSFTVSPTKGVGIRSHHGEAKHWFSADERGGANVGTVDGSVTFLGPDTPPEDVRSMLRRSDGQPEPEK